MSADDWDVFDEEDFLEDEDSDSGWYSSNCANCDAEVWDYPCPKCGHDPDSEDNLAVEDAGE